MKKEIWRTCDFPSEEWNKLKESRAFTWLKIPPYYDENYFSYFTQLGYQMFVENTLSMFIKYLDGKNIIVEKVMFSDTNLDIVYEDEHQIVIKN